MRPFHSLHALSQARLLVILIKELMFHSGVNPIENHPAVVDIIIRNFCYEDYMQLMQTNVAIWMLLENAFTDNNKLGAWKSN